MSTAPEKNSTATPAIRHGMSWADQQDSPGWTAKSPPKFAEEMPNIVLDEEEYDRDAAASATKISVFVGGLDYALEAKAIEEFFASQGCRVSRVRVQKSHGGKSNGKAFMNVSDSEALAAVLKLSGSMLAGRAISVKEDAGPPPRRAEASKGEGRWRDDDKWGKRDKRDSRWQAVGKGGKTTVEHPTEYKKTNWSSSKPHTKPHVEEEAASTVVVERKKLELKPRSKPLEPIPVSTSGIFGGAKPRERSVERIVEKVEKIELPSKPKTTPRAPRIVVQPIILAPIPVVKKKVSSNRFVVSDSDE